LETSLCQYLTDGIDSGLITPRLDRFGTQRQRRPNQRPRKPSQDSSFDIMNGISMFSEAYGRYWIQNNFLDLLSNQGDQKIEWFEVLEGNDCSSIPTIVNAGRPPRNICNEAIVDERRCICLKTGRNIDSDSGYQQLCGECRDPCQLKFTPDRIPKYLQTLAAQGSGNDFEQF